MENFDIWHYTCIEGQLYNTVFIYKCIAIVDKMWLIE